MALVETRNRTFRPSVSEMKVTLHRFGRNRRLVLILEWLTLWPTCGPLAVSSQRRDISTNPLPSPGFSSHLRERDRGSKSRPSWERRTYRGSAAGRQGFAMRAVSGESRKMLSINSLRVFRSQNRCPPPDRVRGHAFAEYARLEVPEKPGFGRRSTALSHHINGVFAADIRVPRPAVCADWLKKRAGLGLRVFCSQNRCPLFAEYALL